jgi:hypothetical protein
MRNLFANRAFGHIMRVLSTRGLGLRGYSQSFGITDWLPFQDLSHLRKSGQSTKDQQTYTRCSISAMLCWDCFGRYVGKLGCCLRLGFDL